MKLYHFTRIGKFFEREGEQEWTADLREGEQEWTADLKPFPIDEDWADKIGFVTEPVVWLTSEPNPKATFQDDTGLWRITVELDRNTRRLVRWEEYLRKHLPGVVDRLNNLPPGPMRDAWGGVGCIYLYFGTVLNARHRAVEKFS
jgi:hypothetical protein